MSIKKEPPTLNELLTVLEELDHLEGRYDGLCTAAQNFNTGVQEVRKGVLAMAQVKALSEARQSFNAPRAVAELERIAAGGG